MKHNSSEKSNQGFSLTEMMISILILVPVMGAAVGLFSAGASQHSSEQSSVAVNQDARSAIELMKSEIAQAGSHGDANTTTTSNITANSAPQAFSVASAAGFETGDWVDIDTGASLESVKLTAVTGTTLSGIFKTNHASGATVRLFAQPFTTGMLPPAGLAANSSANVTTLRFFGNINSDGTLQYVEYTYDNANNRIVRAITPITQANENNPVPVVQNVKPNSVQFTLFTDSQGIVTSVYIAMTVQNTWKTGSAFQESELSSRIMIPSAVAASNLSFETLRYGGVDYLPPTPSKVSTWAAN
jgi:prepilin-type N-terminal cleavage/methylation domain-containing protein